MNEIKKITKKEIVYKDNYISYTKSILHLPIFTFLSDKQGFQNYEINLPKLEGFENVEMKFPRLSIKNDFMTFTFIMRKFYEACENNAENPFEIIFDMNEYFDYFKVARNNRSSYATTILNCIKRLKAIQFSFTRNKVLYMCGFLNDCEINQTKERKHKLEISKTFLNFFKHDTDLIFNINIDNYLVLDKDFSKILYLYYITNLHKIGKDNVASFDKDLIFTRLQSVSADRRKLQLIREANQELVDKKLIKGFSFTKSGNRITKINIKYLSKNVNEAIEEAKQEEKQEEKKEEQKRSIGLFDNIKKIERDFPKNENMGEK